MILSIVIPTKNRYSCLKSIVEYASTIDSDQFEIVIQDNSDDNQEFLNFLEKGKYSFVSYYYENTDLSVIENSDLAVKHARGEYISFIGDDDLFSKYLIDYVFYMKQNEIEAARFSVGGYMWPGVRSYSHKTYSLSFNKPEWRNQRENTSESLKKVIKQGGTSLITLPRLYHGVVARTCLEKVFEKCGTFFPGPSPDMASSIALGEVISNAVLCGAPLIMSGTSKKSAGGMGKGHAHKGNIKDTPWLPKDTEEKWSADVPKIWTGETIYAESVLKALEAMNDVNLTKQFNYSFLYAHMLVFHPDLKNLIVNTMKQGNANYVKITTYSIYIIVKRVKNYVHKLWQSRFYYKKMIRENNIDNSCLAAQLVDKYLTNIMQTSMSEE